MAEVLFRVKVELMDVFVEWVLTLPIRSRYRTE